MYSGASGPPKRSRPRAIRRRVFSLSGRFLYFGSSSRERPGFDQSMISLAPLHLGSSSMRLASPAFAWVASGQWIGCPSLRACRKKRTLVVASP